jgi:hypothetical protein
MKQPAQVDDEDVDRFVAKFCTKLNPALSAEERADFFYDFAIDIIALIEPERSKQWTQELARRVRSRVLWLKPSS